MNGLFYRKQVRQVMSKLLSEDEAPSSLILETEFHKEGNVGGCIT